MELVRSLRESISVPSRSKTISRIFSAGIGLRMMQHASSVMGRLLHRFQHAAICSQNAEILRLQAPGRSLPLFVLIRPCDIAKITSLPTRTCAMCVPWRSRRFRPTGSSVLIQISDATADGGKSHLWLVDVKANSSRQLTWSPSGDKRGESAGQWMPDGESILFVAHRGEHTQLFQLPMNGGEAHPSR
jgi:hypothetical protein